MSSIPDPVITVDNDILKWTSPEGTGQVPLDSIICVVQPQTQQGQQPHRVIFLNKSSDDHPTLESLNIQSVPKELSKYQTIIPPHLNSSESPVSVEVIISTLSGTGTAPSIFTSLIKPFLDTLGIKYTPHFTTSASSITEISKSILLPRSQAGITQNVILLSGDGGLIDILDVFSRSSTSTESGTRTRIAPTISLIPCGTGNAMASSIGLDSPPSVSTLSSLLKGTPHSLPTFCVKFSPGSRIVTDEGRGRQSINSSSSTSPSPSADGSSSLDSGCSTMYGAVVASWGLHAALVADSDTAEYRKFGSERFKMAANELLHPSDGSEIHRFMGDISFGLPGESSPEMQKIPESEHMYVLTTLVPRLEKDFLISPSTQALSPSQGQGQGMRFLRFGPRSAEECMRLMMLAYSGGLHVHEEGVMYEEVKKVRIDFKEENERWRRVCVDGKIVVVEGGGWIEIEINREESVLNVLA